MTTNLPTQIVVDDELLEYELHPPAPSAVVGPSRKRPYFAIHKTECPPPAARIIGSHLSGTAQPVSTAVENYDPPAPESWLWMLF